MTTQKGIAIPKKVIAIWGEDSPAAFNYITQRLNTVGCVGPLTWRETYSIPYYLDTSESIRVMLSLSKCGGNGNTALFDGIAVVMSKSIHDRTIASDPWYPIGFGYDKWHEGYKPCLGYRLSHLKWVEKESTINPAWEMTLETNRTSKINAIAWLSDFESLLLPLLLNLKTDANLARAMLNAINYERPSWVKSDGPGFGRIQELYVALHRSAALKSSE
jgi:hypothetical protein